MRRDLDHVGADARRNQQRANGVGALEAEFDVAGGRARCVGMADDRQVRKGAVPEGLQNPRNERAALIGQLRSGS
jgi:hypothetical protein